MAISYGPKLGLVINADDEEAWGPQLRALLRAIDGLVPLPTVIDHTLDTPPGSPADGDCYIVGPGATGDWAGEAGAIARWSTLLSEWEFYGPIEGWIAWSAEAAAHLKFTTADGWEPLIVVPPAGPLGFIDFRGSIDINGTNSNLAASWLFDTPPYFYSSGLVHATPRSSGKRYFEMLSSTLNPANSQTLMGLTSFDHIAEFNEAADGPSSYWRPGAQLYSDGELRSQNTEIDASLATLSNTDVIGFAVDIDAGEYWISQNGTFLYGDPGAGTGGNSYGSTATNIYPLMVLYAHSLAGEYHGTAADFVHAPPSGFTGWDD